MLVHFVLLVWISLLIRSGKAQNFEPYEAAHVALIGWTGSDGRIKFDCTGSYIGKNMILTGARCLERNGTRADVVRLGEAIDTPRDFAIQDVIVHYRYQAEYYYHNMAIVYLKEHPQTVSKVYKPACILSTLPTPTMQIDLIGRDADGVFQKTAVELVDSDKCHEYYSPTKKFKYGALLVCCMCARSATATTKCASELSAPMQTIMERDGKRVPFLVGQKTIGRSCGSKIPGIYTRLSSDGHFPWIATISEIEFANHEACFERY